jgi:hypothetical protein
VNDKNLILFKEGESGNPNGRQKKLETVIQEYFLGEHNMRLSKSQTAQMIEAFLSKTKKEIFQLAKNEELPFWVEMLVNKAEKDLKKGSIELVEKLWDRIYGKPNQNEEKEPEKTAPPIDMVKRESVLENILKRAKEDKEKESKK